MMVFCAIFVVVRLGLRCFLVMRVLAVHNMARHEVMHNFADDLDPKHAT